MPCTALEHAQVLHSLSVDNTCSQHNICSLAYVYTARIYNRAAPARPRSAHLLVAQPHTTSRRAVGDHYGHNNSPAPTPASCPPLPTPATPQPTRVLLLQLGDALPQRLNLRCARLRLRKLLLVQVPLKIIRHVLQLLRLLQCSAHGGLQRHLVQPGLQLIPLSAQALRRLRQRGQIRDGKKEGHRAVGKGERKGARESRREVCQAAASGVLSGGCRALEQ